MERIKYLVGEEHKPFDVLREELKELELTGDGIYEDEIQYGVEILEGKLKEKKEIIGSRGVTAYFNKTLKDFLDYSEYMVDPKLYIFALVDTDMDIEDDIQELVEIVTYDSDIEGIEDHILLTTTGYELVDIIGKAEGNEKKWELRNRYRVEVSNRIMNKLEGYGVNKNSVKQMSPENFEGFMKSAWTKRGQQVSKESIEQWLESKGKVSPEKLYSKMAELFGGGTIKVSKKGKEVAERLVLEIEKSGLGYGVESTKGYGLPLYIEVEDMVKIVVWEDIRVFREIYAGQGLKNVYSNPTHKVKVGDIKDIVGLLTGDL